MKAKKIFIIALIVILIVAAVVTVLYYKTDIFKSTSQRFWKYAGKNFEVIDLTNNDDIQSLKNMRSNNPYEITSNLFIQKGNSAITVYSNTSAENSSNIFTNVEAQYNDKELINFNMAKKSNLIGIKVDELANGYITLKNSNLSQLAQDAGIENVSDLPENINWFSLLDFLYMSTADEKYFVDTYSKIILNNTSKANYSKEQSGIKVNDVIHTATGYKMELTEKEAKNVAKEILTHLKNEDARGINFISSKLKLMNLPKKYTDYDAVTGQIDKLIEELETYEASDEKYLEVIAYVDKGELLQTNIKVKNGSVVKLQFDRDNNKFFIIQENPNKELEKSTDNEFVKHLANVHEVCIESDVSKENKSVITTMKASFYDNLWIDYNSRFAIVDSVDVNTDFERAPKIVLNDLENDNLKKLYNMIMVRIPKIIEDKKVIMK